MGAVCTLVLSTCVDSEPVGPGAGSSLPAPAAALIDGSTTGDAGFYFLEPLVSGAQPVGTFNPGLRPAMQVCLLSELGSECEPGAPVAHFPPGSAQVIGGQYRINWDTEGPETGPIETSRFYRLRILLGSTVVGSLDLDPQDPDGPGQSAAGPGFYAFRLGETIPVKFWLSTQVLCDVDGTVVLECISDAVLDEQGGELTLDQAGDPLSVFLPAFALPGDDHPPILVRVERIDPDAFALTEGVECIPLFDAPQFGPCFRITTFPELTGELDSPALVSICLDPEALPINAPLEQENELQIVRYATDGSEAIQALTNVPGDCPTETAGLIDVPERGPFRYAALGLNALARFVGPQPALAHGTILLGGLTSSFSRFRFALPGQMLVISGGDQTIQASDPAEVAVVIGVVDSEGVPVENARVHLSAGAGSVDAAEAVTDADGLASVTWTVDKDTAGEQSLTVSALGLLTTPVPDHSSANFVFTTESLTVTATVVGPPAALVVGGDGQIGQVGAPLPLPLTVQVVDQHGNPRSGDPVSWTVSPGSGSIVGDAVTDASGSASAIWTLGPTTGPMSATVVAGGLTHLFSATASCSEGRGTATLDGAFGESEWACASSRAFTANISGGGTPAIVYWMNDGASLYLAVRVRQSSFDKVNSVRFDFDDDGDGVAEPNDDIIGYDVATRAFVDHYLTSKCVNSSQSGCGSADATSHGSGVAANADGWTTYELAHPLTGGGVQDFSRAPGDPLGFFLTLRIGNGAQGNTQVPGFRQYEIITIR